MKIVRLGLIISFLRSAKNIKQYLLYINIGLFLSIFAVSAAVISFVIEGCPNIEKPPPRI